MSAFFLMADTLILGGVLALIILIASYFYIKYDWIALRGLARSLELLSDAGDKVVADQKGRMDHLHALARRSGSRTLITAWDDFDREYKTAMKGQIVPDVTAYINERRLIEVPCARRQMDRLWLALIGLSGVGALLFEALTLLGFAGPVTGQAVLRSFGLALLMISASAFIVFLFRMADAAQLEAVKRCLWRFQYLAAGWLNPVSEPTMIGVLVENQSRNTVVFQEAVEQLAKKIDRFETEALAPLLGKMFRETIENNISPALSDTSAVLAELSQQLVSRQETGMRELAEIFTVKLTAVTAEKLSGFAELTQRVSDDLQHMVKGMERISAEMDESRRYQENSMLEARDLLAETGRIQAEVSEGLKSSLESVAQAELIAAEMRGYAVQGLAKANEMAEQALLILDSNTAQVKRLQTGIEDLAGTLQHHFETAAAQVAVQIAAALAEYASLCAKTETAHAKYGEEMDARITDLVTKLDTKLTANAEALALESRQALAGNMAQTELLLNGLRETGISLSRDLDAVKDQLTGELSRSIQDYAEIAAQSRAGQEQFREAMAVKVNQLVEGLNERLAEHGTAIIERSREAEERFQDSLRDILASNAAAAEKLAGAATEVALEGGRIMEKTGAQASSLYSELAGRMDKSIDALGENLAEGMRTAMANSSEIVEKLAARTETLKELYDSYFSRIEEQSSKMLDEMDFSVQKMFSSFSGETEKIIGRLTDNSGNALEFFDKGIKELMAEMEEHSRGIGLYAKEINLDVADLSGNLRESVQAFSNQMEAGIIRTFEDFDKGLGEVTLRLANILESIRESAEALQKALNK